MTSFLTKVGVPTCGCCTLQRGALIVGIFNLVSRLIILLISIYAVRLMVSINVQSIPICYIRSVSAALFSYMLMEIIASALLITGAINRKANYVFPSVCIGFVHILTHIGTIIGFVTLVFSFTIAPIEIFSGLVVIATTFPLQIYLWSTIFYYHKELIAEYFENVYSCNCWKTEKVMVPINYGLY